MRKIFKNIPNFLSSFRLIAAPVLVVAALQGRPKLFQLILALSLFSDALDGLIARSLKVTTRIGAKLDSWGDFVTYFAVALSAWLLWPGILKREIAFVATAFFLYSQP